MLKPYFSRLKGSGRCPPRKPLSKLMWSWLGAFLGIYAITLLAQSSLINSLFLIGSFGASAVLIYGAPMADFSQPRNLVGGHLISAIVGVTCAKLITLDIGLACALAVSLSVLAMHYSRTLHPPGGATALIAVIGGPQITQVGYWFVLTPVASGAIILLIIALLVNNLSSNPKRHYPTYWI